MDEIGYTRWIPTGNDPPPPAESYMPALQRHGPEGDDGCEFAGQATHALAPVAVEYLPASQATQALAVVAPVVEEYRPAAHATQALSVVAPEVVRYLPAPQGAHALP
jgi:hypothetical protein